MILKTYVNFTNMISNVYLSNINLDMKMNLNLTSVEKNDILFQHGLLVSEQFYGFGSPTTLSMGSINLINATKFVVENPHQGLPILSLVTGFMPVIGPVISAVFGITDAAIYYKEGDNFNAGLALFFETIPYWGPSLRVAGNVLKIDSKFAKALSDKIINKEALSQVEKAVYDFYTNNADTMGQRFKNWLGGKLTGAGLSEVATQKLIQGGINVGSGTAKVATEVGKAEVLSSVYRATYEAATGASFKSAQKWFLSNKSEKDNVLMNKALKAGWKPGTPVPSQYQTDLYKQDIKNLNSLDYSKLNEFLREKQQA